MPVELQTVRVVEVKSFLTVKTTERLVDAFHRILLRVQSKPFFQGDEAVNMCCSDASLTQCEVTLVAVAVNDKN